MWPGHHVSPGPPWPHARMAPPGIAPSSPRAVTRQFSPNLIFKCSNHPWDGNLICPAVCGAGHYARLAMEIGGPGSDWLLRSQSELASEPSHLTPSRLNSPSGRGWAILYKSNARRLWHGAWARGHWAHEANDDWGQWHQVAWSALTSQHWPEIQWELIRHLDRI